ncbi:MAG: cobalamin-binding protein [Bacteroidetes bacterium]|nr:MAG: cobalamin-binding protein [Bacteroidota bacterium]
MTHHSLLLILSQCVIDGRHVESEQTVRTLLGEGASPMSVLDDGLLPGMAVVGQRFRDGEMFLPQVLVSARAMKTAMAVLEPLLAASNVEPKGTVLIGTVKGDVHDIGKNLVSVMLQGNGYRVVDIGTQNPVEKYLAAYEQHRPDVVGLSALLTTTMMYMPTVIAGFRSRGIPVPVIVGGAPVTQRFAGEIGADGYAKNAVDAVDLVNRLLKRT